MLAANLIAKEPCGVGSSMRDQGIRFRQFELERFVQELLQLGLDSVRFLLRSSETEQEVG